MALKNLVLYQLMLLLEIFLVHRAPAKDTLAAPHVNKVITFDPAGIRLRWDLLEGLEDDPIIGYRMNVWELSKKVYGFEDDENGKPKSVEKIVPIEDTFSFDYKNIQPKWTVNVGPDVNEAEVHGVKFGIYHDLKVQALTKNKEGPFSESTLVSLHVTE